LARRAAKIFGILMRLMWFFYRLFLSVFPILGSRPAGQVAPSSFMQVSQAGYFLWLSVLPPQNLLFPAIIADGGFFSSTTLAAFRKSRGPPFVPLPHAHRLVAFTVGVPPDYPSEFSCVQQQTLD